ncbi:hypothetical protein [Bradyrhizobium sp. CCBAU 51627]|uniref:hypothetical protein n=1 Tax=Bradyrhizobium sp. CCBAU 51627 TaxID=1325088 RepID=UPI002305FF30|nr:hypothetical protein [Bradyrhizobium sp. CCBAU 51627]MDA9433869.1 hypothetical protein [Bradyrhizobium sp. CCBAU 51627]
MRTRRARFLKRLAAIESQAPALRRRAEAWIREHYRLHRRPPHSAVTCLLPRRRVYALISLGELEHRLGLAPLLLRLVALRRHAAAVRDRLHW